MPLSMAGTGQKVRVLAIHAGRGLKARLAEIGLTPGIEIEVVSNSFHGPFVLAVKESRLMLGRGIAHKIEVR